MQQQRRRWAGGCVHDWRIGGRPQITEGENAPFAPPTLWIWHWASAAGRTSDVDILKNAETAASVSFCTYAHI